MDKDINEDDPLKVDEITHQIEYTNKIHDELASIECKINSKSQASGNASKPNTQAVKLPKLVCKVFDGESSEIRIQEFSVAVFKLH